MKGDTVLDYVELLLSPTRTRCELFVSANGVTEKLASGFLKPFLMHLQAVEEQAGRGCNSVRLECPQFSEVHGRSWFTKGTLERFVRFVSTPEVLERVKSLEDELAQLEQVRSIQASSLRQADRGFFVGADSTTSKADANIHSGLLEKNESSKLLQPRRYQNDAAENGAEASKIELLRAMDTRVLALHQEQSTAFGRAAAAGFGSKNMADMISFSDYFGAERLRTACINFLAVLKSRREQSANLSSEVVASGFEMLLSNALTGLDVGLPRGPQVDMREEGYHSEDDTNKGTQLNGLSSKGPGGMEVRKRWGPPENIRSNLYADQHETDSVSSNGTSNAVSITGSPEVQSSMKKTANSNLEHGMGQKEALYGDKTNESGVAVVSSQCKDAPKIVSNGSMNSTSKQSSQTHVDCGGSQLSTSSLPFRKASLENSLPCHASLSLQKPLDENNRTVKTSEDGESQKTGEDVEDFETPSTSVVSAPARRLSVQAAISLFENKQRRDSTDSVGKHRSGKQENSRVSLEGSSVCLSGKMALRRWDSAKGLEACMDSHECKLSSRPEADCCPVQTSASSLASQGSSDMSHEIHVVSSVQPLSGTPTKSLSAALWQPSESATEAPEGDWRKQFKLQLEKSLAKECFIRDLPKVKDDLPKIESGLSLPKKLPTPAKFIPPPPKPSSFGPPVPPPPPPAPPVVPVLGIGRTRKEAAEKGIKLLESRQPLAIQGTLGLKTLPEAYSEVCSGQNDLDKPELCLSDSKKTEAMNLKEIDGSNDSAKLSVLSDIVFDQSSGRESLGSSSVHPLQQDMQALVTLADPQMTEDVKDPGGLKGRFYEQYRKLRDAKLMEDQDSKRAEREAKLRGMEETLSKRKAELDARAGRSSKNTANKIRTMKVEIFNADLQTPRKEQQDDGHEGAKLARIDQGKPIGSSTSPPSTPYTSKEAPYASKEVASTSKLQGGRKAGAVALQKGATPPRSSSRPIPSVSPKLAPRSTTAAGNLRKSIASSTTENPLAKSVPCFANLRKENTKPSSGRPLGSARVHPKNGVSGRVRGANEAAPLEVHVNVPARTNFLRNAPNKEEQHQRSTLMRKSCATASDFKTMSMCSDDGVLAPLKGGQRELKTETVAYNKLRRSAVGALQESKPFLRKGHGIGPGTGTGLLKQKASSAVDAAKSSDDEIPTAQPKNDDGSSEVFVGVISESNSTASSENDNMDLEDDAPVESAGVDSVETQEINTVRIMQEGLDAASDLSAAENTCAGDPLPDTDNLHDTERSCHTISLPIDFKTHDRYAVGFSTETNSNPLFEADTLSSKNEEIETLSQHEEHTQDENPTTKPFENQLLDDSTSLRTSSLPHEHDMPIFPHVPASPPSSNVVRYKQSSPFSAIKIESPLGSPASWSSSHLQYTDVIQTNKKWVGCQKPSVASQPPKEPVRGFKRLLKFGRKSRTSELSTTDCISASTTSEGDDDLEDQSRFADEVSSRVRLQETRSNDLLTDYQQKAEEEGPVVNVRSSIPTPPANFRLRDDHMSGGTMLKAPRSFFSLSSLRSRGCEWKSR